MSSSSSSHRINANAKVRSGGSSPAPASTSSDWPPLPTLDLEHQIGHLLPARFTMKEDAIIVQRSDFERLKQYESFDEAFAYYCRLQHEHDQPGRHEEDERNRTGRHRIDRFDDSAGVVRDPHPLQCRRWILRSKEMVSMVPSFPNLAALLGEAWSKYKAFRKECVAVAAARVKSTHRHREGHEHSSSSSGQHHARAAHSYSTSTGRTSGAKEQLQVMEESSPSGTPRDLVDEDDAEADAAKYHGVSDAEAAARLLHEADGSASLLSDIALHVSRSISRTRNAFAEIAQAYKRSSESFGAMIEEVKDPHAQNSNNQSSLATNTIPDGGRSTPLALHADDPAVALYEQMQRSLPRIPFEINSVTGDRLATGLVRAFSRSCCGPTVTACRGF